MKILTFIKEHWIIISTAFLLIFSSYAGIWHLIFWNKFNVDPFAYITLSDIIKEAVYPYGLFAFSLSLLAYLISEAALRIVEMKKPWWSKMIYAIVLLVAVPLAAFFFPFENVFGFIKFDLKFCIEIAAALAVTAFFPEKLFQNYVSDPDRIGRALGHALVALVILCNVAIGKAECVYMNKGCKKLSSIMFVSGKLDSSFNNSKVLGMLGEHLIISDTANTTISVINLQQVNYVSYK